MKKLNWPLICLFGSLALVGYTLFIFCCSLPTLWKLEVPQVIYTEHGPYHYDYLEPTKDAPFDLVDPETAPPEIKDKVMLGYRIMIETQKYAPKYALDQLTCNNCHISAGNTLGGKNGGISLVGVAKGYPVFSERDEKMITFPERLNACFRRSLNGRPLPEDSPEMEGLLAYFNWISKDVEKFPELPWVGLPVIKSDHIPSPKNGAHLFACKCASCHGSRGEGTEGTPPIWGPNSFNDGAGMDTIPKLSVFIYLNMPYGQADLTFDESKDIASFIHAQPRPQFKK